jgi:hypothetical protein
MWENQEKNMESTEDNEDLELLELDSYQFVRPGLWWEILARDKWKCCSCGRTVKEHNIQQFPLLCGTSRWANGRAPMCSFIRPYYINPKFYVPHSGENRCNSTRRPYHSSF